jgi:hypothetical protein
MMLLTLFSGFSISIMVSNARPRVETKRAAKITTTYLTW